MMMMNLLTDILTLMSMSIAAVQAQPTTSSSLLKRDLSLGQLYVYGTNISGEPLFFDNNSIAYVGNLARHPDVAGSAATFNYTDSSSILATPINTTYASGYVSINTTSGSSESVTLSSTEYPTGFYMYGTQLTWLTSERQIQSNWYVIETDTVGILALKWHADGSAGGVDGGVAVVLKTLPGGVA